MLDFVEGREDPAGEEAHVDAEGPTAEDEEGKCKLEETVSPVETARAMLKVAEGREDHAGEEAHVDAEDPTHEDEEGKRKRKRDDGDAEVDDIIEDHAERSPMVE